MYCLFFLFVLVAQVNATKNVAYIHGDVSEDGDIPSGDKAPYDQMLITDTGSTGCSEFRAMVEGEGYTISQHHDESNTLDASFLNQFDVIVFGLHQKVWSPAEKTALDDWIRSGGGILMYSDSAAGGKYDVVGIDNQTGQIAVNTILSGYGMEVTVDQGAGNRSYIAESNSAHTVIWDQPVIEGEGVSPVGVDTNSGARVLIPLDDAFKVSGNNNLFPLDTQGITLTNPVWAAVAHTEIGEGNVIAIFDRQPMWNSGQGSDITQRDNREILRRIVRYLARDYGNSGEWLNLTYTSSNAPNLELTYRQWTGGNGTPGFDYTVRNSRFAVQFRTNLTQGAWQSDPSLVETVATNTEAGGETERVTVRFLPDQNDSEGFARVAIIPDSTILP